jgi:glycosyltransferase 2 family protein
MAVGAVFLVLGLLYLNKLRENAFLQKNGDFRAGHAARVCSALPKFKNQAALSGAIPCLCG